MKRYLFSDCGTFINIQVWAEGETEKEARKKAWDSLTYEQQNNVELLECIDEIDYNLADLSKPEAKAANDLILLCARISENFDTDFN